MNTLYQLPYIADTVMQGVLLFLLLRGPFRKYPVFAAYVLAEFAADIGEGIAYYRIGWDSPIYRKVYWTDHVSVDLLLFLVVIAFTYAALQGNALRPKAAKALGLIVVVTVVLPFALLRAHYSAQHGYFTSQWFNHASQILNFGAAIMNLVLWAALLSDRRRDPQLVSLSIGVGIATTGAAIAWGARRWLSADHRWIADSFMVTTHLAAILLWSWIFLRKKSGRSSPPPSNNSSSSTVSPPNSAPHPDALTTPS